MIQMLQDADLWLLHKLNLEWTNAALDRLLPTVTNLNACMPVIVLAALIAVIFGGVRSRLLMLAIGIAIGLGDGIISKTLKSSVGRLRPHEARAEIIMRALPMRKPAVLAAFQAPVETSGDLAKPGSRGNSFPSSHVINMFSAAAACWTVFGRRAWWMAVIASLVAWSRVYCGVHWPGDLLFSIPAGILCGWFSVRVVDALWKKYGARIFPTAREKTPSLLPS